MCMTSTSLSTLSVIFVDLFKKIPSRQGRGDGKSRDCLQLEATTYYAQIFVEATTATTVINQSRILTATRLSISEMTDEDDDCANAKDTDRL